MTESLEYLATERTGGPGLPLLEPLNRVRTDTLEIAYYESGPRSGDVVLLLHGFPYDIHSYVEVIPRGVTDTSATQD